MLLSSLSLFAATGSWNGVAFTQWNGVAQTAWNGTSISCAGGGGGSLAVDATSPVRWTGQLAVSGTTNSASFTPPANTVWVLCIEGDGTTDILFTPTTVGLTWTQQVIRDNSETTTGGHAAIWTCPQVSSAARTITITRTTAGATPLRMSAKCYVVTGATIAGTFVDTVTANNEGGSTVNSMTTTSITPSANGILFAADCEWLQLGTFQASSDLTSTDGGANYASEITVYDGYKAVTSGVATTANLNAAGSSNAQHKWVQVIIK